LLAQNADHVLVTNIGLVLEDVITFFRSVIDKQERPSFTWKIDKENAKIDVTEVNQHAVKAYIWSANTKSTDPYRKDFRLLVNNNKDGSCPKHTLKIKKNCIQVTLWSKQELKRVDENSWQATAKIPEKGWVGYFIELF
jgi:hypothetical protein